MNYHTYEIAQYSANKLSHKQANTSKFIDAQSIYDHIYLQSYLLFSK